MIDVGNTDVSRYQTSGKRDSLRIKCAVALISEDIRSAYIVCRNEIEEPISIGIDERSRRRIVKASVSTSSLRQQLLCRVELAVADTSQYPSPSLARVRDILNSVMVEITNGENRGQPSDVIVGTRGWWPRGQPESKRSRRKLSASISQEYRDASIQTPNDQIRMPIVVEIRYSYISTNEIHLVPNSRLKISVAISE